eukprot:9499862-Pyramimonas_sp.AAC.1
MQDSQLGMHDASSQPVSETQLDGFQDSQAAASLALPSDSFRHEDMLGLDATGAPTKEEVRQGGLLREAADRGPRGHGRRENLAEPAHSGRQTGRAPVAGPAGAHSHVGAPGEASRSRGAAHYGGGPAAPEQPSTKAAPPPHCCQGKGPFAECPDSGDVDHKLQRVNFNAVGHPAETQTIVQCSHMYKDTATMPPAAALVFAEMTSGKVKLPVHAKTRYSIRYTVEFEADV